MRSLSRLVVVCLSAALVAAGAPVLTGADRPELWILSGQSNACGAAKLPGFESSPRVKIYDPASRKWVPAQDPLPGMGSRGVGPWHAAALEVAKEKINVALTGYAAGGRPIAFWDVDRGGWRTLSARIAAAGQGATVFLWYQGENDGLSQTDAGTYRKKLADLVGRIRDSAGNPTMLVVIVQLGSWRGKGDFMPIREAQRRFVVSDRNALLVPALGRTMKDYVHLNRDGQLELGREIARAILRTRYRKKTGWPGPVLDRAALAADGTHVVAHFAEVERLGGCVAGDFGVVDAEGEAKCLKAEAGNTRVMLEFERAVRLPARLIYGFGQRPSASLVDERGNRAPAVELEIGKNIPVKDEPSEAPNGAGASKEQARSAPGVTTFR